MSEIYSGKCIYCGNQVFYRGGEALIKCGKCRETLVVAEFINEKQRMEAALAEGEKARKALQEAEAERNQAREQLFQTVTTIEQLKNGQEESRKKLKQILQKQDANQKTQEAAITLLSNLYAGQEQNQDILTSLFSQTLSGQKSAEEKLAILQSIAEKISSAQNDIGALIRNVSEYLSMDTMTRNQQIGDLIAWVQSYHAKDVQRLDGHIQISRRSVCRTEENRTADL